MFCLLLRWRFGGVSKLHSAFVSAEELFAARALVGNSVQGVDAARDARTWPQSNNAENAGEDPCQWTGLRVGGRPDLTLAMGTHHVDRVGSVVGLVDNDDRARRCVDRNGASVLLWRAILLLGRRRNAVLLLGSDVSLSGRHRPWHGTLGIMHWWWSLESPRGHTWRSCHGRVVRRGCIRDWS